MLHTLERWRKYIGVIFSDKHTPRVHLANIWLIKEIKILLKIYEIKLPVKENLKMNLPDNYLLAKSRLESLQKRLKLFSNI